MAVAAGIGRHTPRAKALVLGSPVRPKAEALGYLEARAKARAGHGIGWVGSALATGGFGFEFGGSKSGKGGAEAKDGGGVDLGDAGLYYAQGQANLLHG